jgi:ankyrin repeat protein
MKASYYGHLEVIKLLLQNGANINDKVRNGSKMKEKERKIDE